MKKFFSLAVASLMAVSAFVACNEDDNNETKAADLDYSADNADSWHNYMSHVANLLEQDAQDLYNAWSVSYDGGEAFAETFKKHNGGDFTSAQSAVEQIIDGCVDIASEVGETKIGEPYDYYMAGKKTKALYAVESWYSWHSRDDYANNIISIRNSYYGVRSTDYTEAPASAQHSLFNLVKNADVELHDKMVNAIQGAIDAIQAIPQPFRNNINSDETVAAMTACSELESVMKNDLKNFVYKEASESELDLIVTNYVDEVILPTYKDLAAANATLNTAIKTLNASRTNANFESACKAWLSARQPWEQSEAFLFGPVDALGLDPNMDSWPLDQDAIVRILKSNNWDELNYDDKASDDAVEAAQNVRGFHTLEFLLFKDGEPRTVSISSSSDKLS